MPPSFLTRMILERTSGTALRISWRKPFAKPVDIDIHQSPFPDFSGEIIWKGKSDGIHPAEMTGLDPDRRYYFKLTLNGESAGVWSERKVSCEGAFNFRDLGGYGASTGLRTKWGQVFRSDGLANLTERGQNQFRHMGVSQVIDLRTLDEVKASPDKFPDGMPVQYEHLPVRHGEFNFLHAMKRLKSGDAGWLSEAYMVNGYVNSLVAHGKTWGEAFEKMALSDGGPVLFHCTGGKDRTGTLAALLLLSLKVPPETVIEDHQLSNDYIEEMLPFVFERVKSYGLDPEQVRPYFTAPLKGIQAVISHIEETFGHVDAYLVDYCGVKPSSLTRLKERLLEK